MRDAEPTPETAETCLQAARILGNICASVREVLPPRIEAALAITIHYWQRPESGSAEEWVADGEVQVSSEEVEKYLFTWDRFRRALIGFMADYDVILTPAAERPATPHGDGSRIPYTLPYSLTGWPCVVVRAGTAPGGVPIAVQIVARPWRDDVARAAAQVIEGAFGGWQPPALS